MEPKEHRLEYILINCPVCRYPFAVAIGTLLYGCVHCKYVWYKDTRNELPDNYVAERS